MQNYVFFDVLNFSWAQNDPPKFFQKNGILRWWNLDKSLNPKEFKQGVPSTPQHTDSHACTKPGWSRSLSGWSRSCHNPAHSGEKINLPAKKSNEPRPPGYSAPMFWGAHPRQPKTHSSPWGHPPPHNCPQKGKPEGIRKVGLDAFPISMLPNVPLSNVPQQKIAM